MKKRITEGEPIGESKKVRGKNSIPAFSIPAFSIPESKIFRNQSGIDADIPNRDDYKMIRSVTMSAQGKLNIKGFIDEVFTGLINATWGKIEYYGFPSTLVLDNHSVVMASQIYDREFKTQNESHEYDNINTYEKYFLKRRQIAEPKITWLGAPSVVFSYKNRNILKPYLNNSNIINLMFWITSFNSSTCIADFSSNREPKDNLLLYCDKYKDLKTFCKRWQKQNTYYNYYNNNLKIHPREDQLKGKFLTDFESCFERIQQEDYSLGLYNDEHGTNYYQRYNELFTYFYPWDIEGVEIGNIEESELLKLLKEIYDKRMNTLTELRNIIMHDQHNVIHKLNNIIHDITKTDNYVEIILRKISTHEINYTLFLIAKILVLSQCNLEVKIINRKFELNERHREDIIGLIENIIFIMSQPLKLYEYQLIDKTFIMQEVGIYNPTVSSINRKSKFVLFEQHEDDITKITNIYISNKQLVTNDELINIEEEEDIQFNRNNFGGKKSRKRTYRKRRYTNRRYKKRTYCKN